LSKEYSPVQEYLGIVIDYSRDKQIPEQGLALLTGKGFYKKPWEESPQQGFARAATCFSFGDYDFAQRIYDYASKGWFTFASPVLSNAVEVQWPTFSKGQFEDAGDWLQENVEPDGMPISCFLSYIPDTRKGLVEARSEASWLSMMGGGVGVYAANRSPDEKSTGVMAHLRGYDADTLSYKQTASRRGSMAAYLDIDHPEIMSFIQMRNPVGGDSNKKCFNLNNAVNITDKFMQAVISGDDYELIDPKHGSTGRFLNAREVWEQLMDIRYETGEPYIMFKDTVNRNIPSWITHPLYSVSQSNLCVAPETQVLTNTGCRPIAEMEGENVLVWNGVEFSETVITKTGENQKLVKVVTSSGQELDCTLYHKWYVADGYSGRVIEKRTNELSVGDKLIKFDLPVIEGSLVLDEAYENGFFSADGCEYKGVNLVYFYHEKRNLIPLFNLDSIQDQPDQKRSVGKMKSLRSKYFVPSNDYTVDSRLKWLAGWLDGDGCVYRNGSNQQLVGSSVEPEFLREVQRMLQTMGVSAKISKNSDEGYKPLPKNDGSGESGMYWCKSSERLLITSMDVYRLMQLGLGDYLNRLSVKKTLPQRDAKQFNKVVSVVDEGRFDDTYCFTEKNRGMGMFNGILTGQCSEITLRTTDKRTAVCCLSSLNVEKYEEWKDSTIVEDLIRLLDNVLEYFIRLAPPELKRAVHSASKERALGLGTLGMHSFLQSKNIAFESGGFNSAVHWTHKLYGLIKERAVEESKRLAAERGECDDCYGSGMRNSHLLAIAPNASSSSMVGTSPSIEPWAANAFNAQGRAGSFLIKNKYLEKVLEAYGKNTPEVWKDIIVNEGSVQHLDWLDEDAKKVFKTATEINPAWLVELAAARQQYICQSQSLNIFVPNDVTLQEMSDIHIKGWVMGIKTFYYCRSKPATRANLGTGGDKPLNSVPVRAKIEFESCLSCEG
jgi:ribonucleoside-diphosphate reductase alpha chain